MRFSAAALTAVKLAPSHALNDIDTHITIVFDTFSSVSLAMARDLLDSVPAR
jgi:hypothetical protein